MRDPATGVSVEPRLHAQPKEVDRLPDLCGRVADRRGAGELHHVTDALLHRFEVANDEAHVREDLPDPSGEIVQLLWPQVTIDLEMHDGLSMRGIPSRHDPLEVAPLISHRADHGMQQTLDLEAASGELLGHRVDEER